MVAKKAVEPAVTEESPENAAVVAESIWEKLAKPFPRSEVQGRIQGKAGRSGKSQVVAYVDARTVMKRLDEVLGPQNWKDEVRLMEGGSGFISRISIRIPDTGEWVYREDVADLSSIEALKGGASDAFKRTAVKFGIGRYLYDLPVVWVDLNGGNYLPRDFVYPLPAWAVAEGDSSAPIAAGAAAVEDQPVWGGSSKPAKTGASKVEEDLL